MPYVYGLGIFALPNLYVAGAVFFAVAALTRRAIYTYVALVAFFVMWGTSQELLRDLDNRHLGALLDPFGLSTFALTTRYWTIVERNTQLLPIEGNLLLNRALWIGAASLLLWFTLRRFRMSVEQGGKRAGLLRAEAASRGESEGPDRAAESLPVVTTRFGSGTAAAQWFEQTRLEVRSVLFSLPFFVLMLFGLLNLGVNLIMSYEGTTSYPLTRRMISAIEGGFELFLFIVIVVYAGRLVWKERQARMHELYDALPVPDWVPLTAKLATVMIVTLVAALLAVAMTIGYQAATGYLHFEPALYFKGLFVLLMSEWLLLCVLAVSAQVITNQKFVGFLVMVLYFVAMEVFPLIGWNHHLYQYGTTPTARYSDMNGYGHFVTSLVWFNVYWWLLAAGLVVLSGLLWVRGTDSRLGQRLRLARERLTRGPRVVLGVAVVGFVVVGSWIFYNTNILNEYETKDDRNRLRAEYEKRYKQYEGLPQPYVTGVRMEVDIDPESRRADIRGDLHLVNKTAEPIETLHLLLNPEVEVNELSLPDELLEVNDEEVGYRIYRLSEPLDPGAPLDLRFDLSVINRGFVNHGSNDHIVRNGTFFSSSHCVPRIGYAAGKELIDPGDRKDFDLPTRSRMAAVDDAKARLRNPFSHDADRVSFEAVISTSPDQIAITPGYLQREWLENGRRFFHYKMDQPVFNDFAFLSGRFEVARDDWNGVEIAVYYHKDHYFNVNRMIEAVKKTLEYCTANFGPYPYRQMRVIEFPRYQTFAQSLPNTIAYSESAHFVDDIRDPDDIDMVFYITAHETAHQWWGHQVCGGNVQGWSLIIESLTQYSALMVMEKEYGPERMDKFLAHELDRYLSLRADERREEMPLMLVEDQGYVHYHKGSLIVYALRDYLGEEAVNAALRKYLQATAFQDPPYTNSLELLACIREVTPDHLQYLIEDMFETITLYDNRTEEATFTRTDDGRYRVHLAVQSNKLRADGHGAETEVEHNDWIEIGVFGREEGEGASEEVP
ncbi:MAG: hypothetical protein JSU68_04380, partial [Phycisphaerales bacterium]